MNQRLLLDTHVLLWMLENDPRIDAVVDTIQYAGELWVSIASLWEITIKSNLGKLTVDFKELLAAIDAESIRQLPIARTHLEQLMHLPQHHRDPFDRLLIAQAITEQMPVLTHDRAFAAYGAPMILF